MCRCAEAVARTAAAFLRSCFGARRRRDALVHTDPDAEVISDDEKGLVRVGRFHQDLADGAGIDKISEGFKDTDDPTTPTLPKAWNDNGIPNTTTKYREDQRVNWHTTPFEQRLLKALSDDEDFCLPRKVIQGKLFHFDEKAE